IAGDERRRRDAAASLHQLDIKPLVGEIARIITKQEIGIFRHRHDEAELHLVRGRGRRGDKQSKKTKNESDTFYHSTLLILGCQFSALSTAAAFWTWLKSKTSADFFNCAWGMPSSSPRNFSSTVSFCSEVVPVESSSPTLESYCAPAFFASPAPCVTIAAIASAREALVCAMPWRMPRSTRRTRSGFWAITASRAARPLKTMRTSFVRSARRCSRSNLPEALSSSISLTPSSAAANVPEAMPAMRAVPVPSGV